ncbi:glycosyltransferase [bacterium]|nr:glycosyltransferase [bacterium]
MTSTETIRFSVIMPAYNEGRHLAGNIEETMEIMRKFNEPFEVVIVDDCSTDNTAEIIRDASRKYSRVKGLVLTKNQGKGHALKAGFEKSEGEVILFLDADLELHPRQFENFYKIMQSKKVDIVIGSKRHPESVLKYPLRRRVMSMVYFLLVKILFGLPVRDTQTGIKIFKRNVLEYAFPKMLVKKYAFDLELLVLAHHARHTIAEAPVEVHYKAQLGHIRLGDIFNIWWDTMAIFYRLYMLHYYTRKNEDSG